ncbi:MAG TPA: hypothetical protein VM871_01370, partial [Flavisolibacter sp.]|nr:hypothetical protein [Flavisolibacter sp.]
MKKIAILSACFVMLALTSIAQDDRAYTKGSSTVSVGYGLGNIWKSLFTLSSFGSDGSSKTTS